MELALSLGDASKPFPNFLEKPQKMAKDLGFCMGLGPSAIGGGGQQQQQPENPEGDGKGVRESRVSSNPPPVQLDLLPFSPVPLAQQPSSSQLRLPWITDHLMQQPGSSDIGPAVRGVDVNRMPAVAEEEAAAADEGAALSSPNSAASSFQMDFSSIYRGGGRRKRDVFEIGGENEAADAERASSRASDDDENALTRKKLRLSKDQSAFLEESFKEHHTLNPKQKLALANQLNLRPRQVEVWFQNRRARTKLKQTEVDCEYLRRCCETLTEDNRRLQKEVQELRALKTSKPFYMQLPATTLTMCPSCERVATTTTSTVATAAAGNPTTTTAATAAPVAAPVAATGTTKPRFYPFSDASQKKSHQAAASAS